MVSPARRDIAAPLSMRAVRTRHVSQSDMTELDLRRSICDGLNPIKDSEREIERERARERGTERGRERGVRDSIKSTCGEQIQNFFYYF